MREAFRTVRRMPGIWAMSVITMAVTIGVGGLFALLAMRAHTELASVRSRLSIDAFFDPAMSSDQASEIVQKEVRTLPQVASVDFTSKEQAVQEFSKSSGENVEEVLGMNPLPASVTVRLKDPSAEAARSLEQKLRGVDGVRDVKSDLDLITTIEQRSRGLDTITLVLGGMMLLTAIFFMLTMARMGLASRRDTLNTMRMLGASRSLLVTPFAIEGGLAGLFGGFIGGALLLVLQHQAFSAIGGGLTLFSTAREHALILAACAATGVVLGGMLTWLFVRVKS